MHQLVLFVAIPFVGCVDNLVVAWFALHAVLVPQPAPLRLQRTCELYPFACELISILRGLPCVWGGDALARTTRRCPHVQTLTWSMILKRVRSLLEGLMRRGSEELFVTFSSTGFRS